MKLVPIAAALATAAILAGCDRPGSQTAANDGYGSGTAATTPASPTSPTATPDNTSPNAPATANMQPGPAGDASGPVSETITTGKIKAALAADSGLKDSDISVTTKDGVVSLSGTAKSQDQVAMATTLAQSHDGVTRVENNISVK